MELTIERDIRALHADGIISLRGAFPRAWAEQMREDMMAAFWSGIQRSRGAIGRGPRRWYVGMHPQELTGFVELASHPWVMALSEAVLGHDYQIVEVGLDVPFQGAKFQPWHRDFPSPPETYEQRRFMSLAFNLSGVDVTEDMGPFEVVPGTQYDDGRTWKDAMFPPEDLWPGFAARGVRKYPRMGDISARSAVAIHRGTAHASPIARPVLVLGMDSVAARHEQRHTMTVTKDFQARLPESVSRHLPCRVVDELTPLKQVHDIEGLVMSGAA